MNDPNIVEQLLIKCYQLVKFNGEGIPRINTKDISNQRNADITTYRDVDQGLNDFYTSYDEFATTKKQQKKYEKFKDNLKEEEEEIRKGIRLRSGRIIKRRRNV